MLTCGDPPARSRVHKTDWEDDISGNYFSYTYRARRGDGGAL